MTLVGKIFTVAILIMSVLFMGFSVMVFATHKNWKERAINPTATATVPLGLKQQVEQRQQTINQMKIELENAKSTLAHEKAARRQVLASLQSKLAQAMDELGTKERLLADTTAALGVAAKELELANNRLRTLTTEIVGDPPAGVVGLREQVRLALEDRDSQFKQVVGLTDQIHQTQGDLQRFQERSVQLASQITAMKKELDAAGLKIGDSEYTTPKVNGEVKAVNDKDLIVISIGSDDGLRIGDQLHVYRDRSYLGRVTIKHMEPHQAVAQIVPEFRQGPIQKGDRVATKLS